MWTLQAAITDSATSTTGGSSGFGFATALTSSGQAIVGGAGEAYLMDGPRGVCGVWTAAASLMPQGGAGYSYAYSAALSGTGQAITTDVSTGMLMTMFFAV